MTWLIYALVTAFLYAVFDVFVRLSSDKISPITGAVWMNTVAALTVSIFFIYNYIIGTKLLEVKQHGWLFARLAGISVGLLSMTFIRVFAEGANVALGITVVRAVGIVIATLIGVLILKEDITLRTAFGILLSVVGVYMVIAGRL